MITPEALAQIFHDEYERQAPEFGYTTRRSSAQPWEDVPEPNKSLMIAVAKKVLDELIPDDDKLHEEIVNVLEAAGWRGDWNYSANTTALQAANEVAEIIVKNIKEII